MGADEVIAEARTRLESLVAPIDGGVGRDVSYEASFENVKAEVDKANSLEGGKIDWTAVAANARTILEDESKDFRIVLYYAAGRAQSGGAQGVFEGLVVLDQLTELFWEPMYPGLKRPKARGNLCSWYQEITAPLVDVWNPTLKERELGLAMEKVFRRVDGDLAEKLGDSYPGMASLREAIRRMVARIPAEAPPPPPPPPPPAPRAEAAPSSVGSSSGASDASAGEEEIVVTHSGGGGGYSPDDIVDAGTAYTALAEILPVLKRASQVFREGDGASPEAHRLSRVASLLFLNGPLPADGGETSVEAPDGGTIETVAGLFASEDWEGLAKAAESITGEMPLWLDGHFYAARAYENLGEGYDGARRVI